jgi:hypothetical protein
MLKLRCILTALLLVTFVAPDPSCAATPEQVDQAVEKAKGWLYSQQANGHWDNEPPSQEDQSGGLTAFVVYTLLAMGESPQDDRLKQAIDWMLKNEAHGTYAISLRCQVWNHMPKTPEVRAALKKDADKLHFTMGPGRTERVRGFYSYKFNNQSNADPSCSQYGALGMWAAAQAGVEVPETYWQQVDKQWRKLQDPSGGWSYQGEPGDVGKIRASMTAAGATTLYIAQDQLNAGKPAQCKGNISDPDIDRAMKWMTEHFDIAIKKGGYGLYTLERMGLASGRKYIGTHDWYQEGADQILKRQHANGSFPNQVPWLAETCFNTLFLVRGRAPLVMNKLEYSLATNTGEASKVANWNQRPRDVANVVHWIGKQTERHLAWQITSLNGPVEDLLDAPILYIAGNQVLRFTDDELAKLKAYVEDGGLILGNPDCAAPAFADSFKTLGRKLFPAYEFAPLPDGHPIYTNQQFNRAKWKRKPTITSLSNGARELMILLPDAARAWQTQDPAGKEELFQSAANIFLYAVDTQGLRARGVSHFVKADPKVKASKPIKVARISYEGNSDPEPGGWRRLAAVMHNASQGELTVETVKPDAAKLEGFHVAHLTGTRAFTLTPPAREEIKRFVSAGGTLVVDSTGGSSEFANSAETELAAMFGADDARQLKDALPPSHALYSAGGKPREEAGYRNFARVNLGSLKAPQLRGIEKNGRLTVIYSREDLSVGLVGHPVDGIIGYDPQTATTLMSSVLVYSTEKKAATTSK